MRHKGWTQAGRADRFRVAVASAYGIATRGSLDELAEFDSAVLEAALVIAKTPGVLSGPHTAAAEVLSAALRDSSEM